MPRPRPSDAVCPPSLPAPHGLRSLAVLLAAAVVVTDHDWMWARWMPSDAKVQTHGVSLRAGHDLPPAPPAAVRRRDPGPQSRTGGLSAHAPGSLLSLDAGATGVSLPPATPPRASSESELWPARLDPRAGVAGGIPEPAPAVDAPRLTGIRPGLPVVDPRSAATAGGASSGMPFTQAPATNGSTGAIPSDGASRSIGAGFRQAASVVAAGGLAAMQFLRSGAWTGEARTTFERDSRHADTEGDQFELARQSAQAAVAIRNPQLVLGPRLLVGQIGLDLALMRDAYTINGSTSPGTGRIVGYDVGTTAVPDRRYSAGFFASRTQTVLPVLFGTSRDQLTAQRGVRAHLKGPLLDSTLEWRWSRFEARARTQAGTLRDGEERSAFSYVGNRQSDRQSLSVEHRKDDRRDLVYPDLSFPLRFSNLRHVWIFGESARRQILSTSVSATRRGGIQPADYQRGEMRLDYRFTPTFESRTAYRRDRVDAKTFGRDQHAVDMQLQHRLYKSLVTTAAGRFLQDAFRSGNRRVRGGLIQLDYRKRLLAGGRLSASVGRRLDREDNRFSELEDVVIGEVHQARLGLPFRLQRDRVVPGPIVVTDATGTIVYREPVDYTVDYIGDFAEIRIQPDGRILDGRPVLVDYRVRVSPMSTVETRQPSYVIAVDYGWINPYFQSTTIDRELVRGVDDGTVFGRSLRVEGINLRWNPARTRIALRNERRTEDARNLSYEAFLFGQQVSVDLGGGWRAVANLDEARFEFTRPVRLETRLAGQVDFRWQVNRALTLTATSSARTRRDTAGIDETFKQGAAEVTWERRLLYASMLVGQDWGERDGQRFGGLRVSVRVARMF